MKIMVDTILRFVQAKGESHHQVDDYDTASFVGFLRATSSVRFDYGRMYVRVRQIPLFVSRYNILYSPKLLSMVSCWSFRDDNLPTGNVRLTPDHSNAAERVLRRRL